MSVEDSGFAMLASTGEAQEIVGALKTTTPPPPSSSAAGVIASIWIYGGMLSWPALAYHGYKRNDDSIGWGFAWSCLWPFFPVAPVIAVVQGFGKPAKKKKKARPVVVEDEEE